MRATPPRDVLDVVAVVVQVLGDVNLQLDGVDVPGEGGGNVMVASSNVWCQFMLNSS